ncbi:expressed unknown protein [Seminavis robusta]|uniref:ChrR-like cupin domain-containing protein n=1 Tax=Seminavis robusta TaxID=568900 RepID=A0A9N8HYM3_9STRA|nr:expressed unknown protein [Seminavis robusta]|eukprot:Sro2559_g331280.2  (195) ;mRNA; f:12829-13572
MLDRVGEEKARATTIVEYSPNSKFPKHTHIGGEEFLVLKGTFKDQHGAFPAGTYVRNPIGSEHAPWVDGDGCTIMVKLLQKQRTASGKPVDYGTVLDLYDNTSTGEHVEMCWVSAGKTLPPPSTTGGEELFIMEGSLQCKDEEYVQWGWLRFPPNDSSQRHEVKAGLSGAQVYRKCGHLTEDALKKEKIQIKEE